MKFESSVSIEPEELAIDMASQLTQDEVVDFVEFLDMQMCDWQFTERLHKFFKKEHKIYKKEVKDFG